VVVLISAPPADAVVLPVVVDPLDVLLLATALSEKRPLSQAPAQRTNPVITAATDEARIQPTNRVYSANRAENRGSLNGASCSLRTCSRSRALA
jgi:hypothetical protein